jgi:DNA-3-methyladenine glycosylase
VKTESLAPDFFRRDPLSCARDLIGCTLFRGGCAGTIVETEAYEAVGDPACHTDSRAGARAFVAERAPGTLYVYLNYGVHWLLNFLAKGESAEGFVLIRALEPVSGIDLMSRRRGHCAVNLLCAGPGRLTRALGIDGSDHGQVLSHELGGRLVRSATPRIVHGPRIGISRARQRTWRFGAAGSPCLSRRFEA